MLGRAQMKQHPIYNQVFVFLIVPWTMYWVINNAFSIVAVALGYNVVVEIKLGAQPACA
jgi:hypothetical protein